MNHLPPKNIYRYMKFNAVNIASICMDALYFSDPSKFNDPLDCQPNVVADGDMIQLRILLTELIKMRMRAATVKSLKQHRFPPEKAEIHGNRLAELAASEGIYDINYWAHSPEVDDPETYKLVALTTEIELELLKRYEKGVCCFSSEVCNPVLWSHYGDEHNGFCVGYSLDRRPAPKLHKVTYGGDRIINTSLISQALLDKDPTAINLLDKMVLLRKASSWRYEREWRLIDKVGLQESPLLMTDITFGLRCPIVIKHAVIKSMEGRDDLKFYKIYQTTKTFKLKRRKLNPEEITINFPQKAESGEEMFGDLVV